MTDWIGSPTFPPIAGCREIRLMDFDVMVFDPPGEHTATVFWLHGLGDTGGGIVPGVLGLRKHLSKELGDGIKFMLPRAPKMKVTGNFSQVMPSWFDCYSFDIENRDEDALGIAGAADWLDEFIDLELSACPHLSPSRIVIGGLSQGAAVACRTVVGTERSLGGAFMLSGYVPLRKRVPELKTPLASTIPMFWGHGTLDPQVPFTLALRSAKQLSSDLGIGFIQSGIVPLKLQEVLENDCVQPVSTSATSGDGGSSSSEGAERQLEATPRVPKLRFVYYATLGHWYSDEELRDLAVWMDGILGSSKEGRREKGVEGQDGEGPGEEGGGPEAEDGGGGAVQTGPGDGDGDGGSNASAHADADGGE